MVGKKTQTILNLKQSIPYDMLAVLESIFFRSYSTKPMPDAHRLKHLRKERIVVTSVDMAKKGLDLMNHVKQRQIEEQPYRVKKWKDYLKQRSNGERLRVYQSKASRVRFATLRERNTARLKSNRV